MRNPALWFLAVLLAFPAAAPAQGPGSFARYSSFTGGMVRLDANFVASDTCQAALGARQAAPAGQRVQAFTVPVTIVIGPNPAGCGNSRIVRRIVSVGAGSNTQLIQIFFVNPAGRILKVEKVAIATF